MKELSIEQKAKRYDEAIERVKNIKTGKYETTFIFTEGLFEHIFPELEESEDERIRKQIISFLKEFEHDHYRSLDFSSWIAWLEKQGEQIDIANKEYWRGYREGMEVILDKYSELEKQGEHKSVDKVEPKFKVGDWVLWDNKISCFVNNIYRDGKSLMYAIIDTNNMIRTYSVKGFDNNAHLWTIEDAKKGDVLVASDGSIFIYKYQRDNGVVHYIAVTPCDVLEINENDYSWERKDVCHPATKDEQTVLFERMKEAGYEWDAMKKQLKKL